MLLWINGPFGGGKSQTARELHSRLPGSLICDPELLGFGLHRMLPPQLRGDFQDFPAWRQGVYEVLDLALRSAGGTVIAPMTLIEPAYFTEIIGRLTDAGHDVRHFALLADRRVIERPAARARNRARHSAAAGAGRAAVPRHLRDVETRPVPQPPEPA